jgi:hypothetical protein
MFTTPKKMIVYQDSTDLSPCRKSWFHMHLMHLVFIKKIWWPVLVSPVTLHQIFLERHCRYILRKISQKQTFPLELFFKGKKAGNEVWESGVFGGA